MRICGETKMRNEYYIIYSAVHFTGKSMSEALIFASTNQQYDNRLFIDLPVQYMKTTSLEHGENMMCAKIVLNVKTKTKNNLCSPHVLSLLFSCIELVNQWTICCHIVG